MTALTTHIGKELRHHRNTIIGLAAILTLFVIGACFVMSERLIEGALVGWFTIGAFLGSPLIFAPILSEQPGRTLGLLQRLPGGVRAAFWSKVMFLLLVVAGFTVFAFLVSNVVGRLFLMGPLDWDLGLDISTRALVSLVTGIALWIFAISWWLPRASLTLPTTALSLGLMALPYVLVLRFFDGSVELLGNIALDPETPFLWIAHPTLALFVAWLSFARGRRSGRGPGSAAWRGLAVVGSVTLGLTGISLKTLYDATNVDLGRGLTIENALVGAGGRYAFFNASCPPAEIGWVPIIVDLESGEWRKVGGTFGIGVFASATSRSGLLEGPGERPIVAHFDGLGGSTTYLDAATAEPLDDAADIEALRRASARATTSLRLPDGRSVWYLDGRLEGDDGHGEVAQLQWPENKRPRWPVGYGFRISNASERIYDLTRQRSFETEESWKWRCWVLREHWLVADLDRPRSEYMSCGGDWRLLDPETGKEQPAPGMTDGDRVVGVLPDGQVLVQHRDEPGTPGLFRVDTASGSRARLQTPGFSPIANISSSHLLGASNHRFLCSLTDSRGTILRRSLVSLAADSDTFTAPVPCYLVVVDDDTGDGWVTIISADKSSIDRVNLDTGESRVLFPRPMD